MGLEQDLGTRAPSICGVGSGQPSFMAQTSQECTEYIASREKGLSICGQKVLRVLLLFTTSSFETFIFSIQFDFL